MRGREPRCRAQVRDIRDRIAAVRQRVTLLGERAPVLGADRTRQRHRVVHVGASTAQQLLANGAPLVVGTDNAAGQSSPRSCSDRTLQSGHG